MRCSLVERMQLFRSRTLIALIALLALEVPTVAAQDRPSRRAHFDRQVEDVQRNARPTDTVRVIIRVTTADAAKVTSP